MSYEAAVADFLAAMEMEGMHAVEPIAQRLSCGELIRFRCEGDGKGRQNGWAILYLDERPAGAFGNYRMGLSAKWKAGEDRTLSPAERERLQREWHEAKVRRLRERAASAQEAALDAGELWERAGPASPDHSYAARKRLVLSGLRQLGDQLLVPMFDAEGTVRNLQRIKPDGTKRFLKGGQTDALFFVFGRFTRAGETACLGEGLATMSAVHAASGYPCIAAFSEKNIGPVARLWHAARPDLDFILCADDDAHLVDNPRIGRNLGLDAARAAANQIGARVALPLGRAA
jgi:putative DNA primase/helicase